MPMQVTPIVVGLLGVNCYLVVDNDTKEAMLVDPGDRPHKIVTALETKGVRKLQSIWITHVHFDHIAAAEEIAKKYHCPIFVSKKDLEGAKKAPAYGKMMAEAYESFFRIAEKRAQYVDFDKTYTLGSLSWRAIAVPGHSAESVCLYFEKENKLIDGDTLFAGTIGREDMYINEQGGEKGTLLKNIRQKLLTLPHQTVVFPGHGLSTTIGNEQHFARDIFGTDKGL